MNISMDQILEILEKELYAYNEGCTGNMCTFTVLGKENAARKIEELLLKGKGMTDQNNNKNE